MEWLEQTKRISKEEDYMGLAIIDEVTKNLYAICPELLSRHRKFFNDLCDYYHKDNPVDIYRKNNQSKRFKEGHDGESFHEWQASFCRQPKGYPKGGCRAFKFFRKTLTEQLEIQIERFEKAQEVIRWQWWEVIDFIWERPELVNISIIDDYVREQIDNVCEGGIKKNPLKNGISKRFGKFWKDESGKWHTERRKRF